MIPLVTAIEWFPERKGLMSGIIIGSYGLGSFIYTLLAKAIVNPENKAADVPSGQKDLSYFKWEVAKNVPYLLRVLSIIWAV